jgi:hypothetical protein
MNLITRSLLLVSTVLALSACSDELATQAKKAAAEIAAEANKAVTEKIEQSKNEAIGQFRELIVLPETQKKDNTSETENDKSSEKHE